MAQKGAQGPVHIRNPDPAEYLRVLELCPDTLRWSAAPVLSGAGEFAQALRARGYPLGGIVEAAFLLDDMYVEAIADGIHLPPLFLKMIWKIIGVGRVYLVTDSMRAAGMPNGRYYLGGLSGGQEVDVSDGVAWLPDRTGLAGQRSVFVVQ
jgi:N-acetylglucosamine-6-phosphate deacetylase